VPGLLYLYLLLLNGARVMSAEPTGRRARKTWRHAPRRRRAGAMCYCFFCTLRVNNRTQLIFLAQKKNNERALSLFWPGRAGESGRKRARARVTFSLPGKRFLVHIKKETGSACACAPALDPLDAQKPSTGRKACQLSMVLASPRGRPPVSRDQR